MSATAAAPRTTRAAAPRRRPRVPAAVWALSVFAAAAAVALALTTFRHLSIDNDDGVYLLQARILAHGHLTGVMSENPRATEPWFFAITSHGYVPKYLPVVALLYALGLVLFGSVVPVLAALAFVLPLVTWGLARSVGLPTRRALAATGVVSLSPAVVIQGGLVLSYLPFLVLLLTGWTLLLRVWRSGNPWAAGAFGVVAATAACFRPLDPVLLLGPAALFVVRRLGRRAVRPVLLAVAGAAPIGLLVLVYDAHATGSAFRLPFALLTPNDALGYGVRQLVPEDPPLHFGPVQGLHGAWLHFVAEPSGWMLGFLVVLPLALWNLRRGGAASPQTRLLASSAAVFAVAYLAFWGPWNTSVLWGGPDTVGPFYALPLLPPLALAAASWTPPRRHRLVPVVAVLAVAALVGNVVTIRTATERNWQAAQRTTAVLHVVRDAPGSLLLDVDPPYLAHPVGAVGDQRAGDGRPILLSSQLSPAQVATDADPTLLQVYNGVYGSGGLNYQLVHEVRTTATSIPLHLTDGADVGRRAVLVVSRGGLLQACAFAGSADLTLTATAVTGCTGAPMSAALRALVAERPYRLCATTDCLSFSLFRLGADGRGVAQNGWRMTRLLVDGDAVTTLTDGATIRTHGSGWLRVTTGP